MFNSGFVKSNLDGIVPLELSSDQKPKLPSKYSIVDQIDGPHDQGSRGICVSVCTYDMCRYLSRGTGKELNIPVDYFYEKRQDKYIDGMSPREALEIAQADGLIKSYAFLGNMQALKYSILSNGPTMACMPVYTTSFDDFWVSHGDGLIGFHATTFVGYDSKNFILRNSWGIGFGKEGYVKFPFRDFKVLMEAWTIFN